MSIHTNAQNMGNEVSCCVTSAEEKARIMRNHADKSPWHSTKDQASQGMHRRTKDLYSTPQSMHSKVNSPSPLWIDLDLRPPSVRQIFYTVFKFLSKQCVIYVLLQVRDTNPVAGTRAAEQHPTQDSHSLLLPRPATGAASPQKNIDSQRPKREIRSDSERHGGDNGFGSRNPTEKEMMEQTAKQLQNEAAEADRVQKERERQDAARQESAERERQKQLQQEKEMQERERQEREGQERERQGRERQEQERQKKENQDNSFKWKQPPLGSFRYILLLKVLQLHFRIPLHNLFSGTAFD